MLGRQLITKIAYIIAKYSAEYEQAKIDIKSKKQLPPFPENDIHNLFNEFDSLLTFNAFNELTTSYDRDSDEDFNYLTNEIMEKCDRILGVRWDERLKNTNLIPCHVNTSINHACKKIADILAVHYADLDSYQLLIPPLEYCETQTAKKKNHTKLATLHGTEFILSDDNTAPIDIYQCLLNAKKTTKFTHTCREKEKILLTEAEKDRVINHCEETKAFYQAENMTDKSRCDLLNKLRSKNFKLQHGYDQQSSIENFLGNLGLDKNTVIESKEDILEILQKSPRVTWEVLLKILNTPEVSKLLLNGKKLEKIVAGDKKSWLEAMEDRDNYILDEQHDSAMLFLFMNVYRMGLENRKESTTGILGGLTGITTARKLQEWEYPGRFFLKGRLLEELPEYINAPEFASGRSVIQQSFSTSARITNQLLLISQLIKESKSENQEGNSEPARTRYGK